MILNAHSYYSLRYGTLSNEELIDTAIANNYDSVALTDINNTTGTLQFVKLCLDKGIRPIVGAEFRSGERLLYVVIARNKKGFKEVNDMLTAFNLEGRPYAERPVFSHCYIIYPYGKSQPEALEDNEYIGVRLSQLNRILVEKKSVQEKYVILQSSTFKNKTGYEVHKKLRAIDLNALLDQLQPEHVAGIDEYIIPKEKLLKYFEPFPHIIANTCKVMYDCSFEFDFTTVKNKKHYSSSAYEDKLLLEKTAMHGFTQRYSAKNTEALKRLKQELEIIDKLGFSAYFLITWDMVQFSWSRGYYHYGRGSGANSIVAYCLRITDVCPIELDLYFERFLNPKRNSPPDFDIDYSWKDRDHVYQYMFDTYGKERTALLGAMVTFQDRSIIREMGKVYGLPKSEIDRLIHEPSHALNQTGLCREVLSHYNAIADYPSIRSIHAGGILISEEPLTCYTALDMPRKGYPTSQFDMHIAEDIGIEKLDILSQRGLGHIKEAGDLVLKNQGIGIDVHQTGKFKTDVRANDLLRTGNTIGCFYIESPAMRGLMRKLQCADYLTLVAASSIIRPGVAKSGMMKAYIQRTRRPDDFEYLHPIMQEQLKETHGVMVYQEDVIRIAHYFGGLDLSDADVLRRMMSGKGKQAARFSEIEKKYYAYCDAQQYPPGLAKEVWRQIESFAGFSFAKGHSASYAAESYQSLYLKAYYPLEFIVAVINNFGGFYRTKVYVYEARKLGATLNLPCVNKSAYMTTLYGKDLFLGFVHVKSLNETLARRIGSEREANGNYASLEHFRLRTGASLEQVIILIRLDALRFTGMNKAELLWEAHILYNGSGSKKKTPAGTMFAEPAETWQLPTLSKSKIYDAYDELELLEFPVSLTEFDLIKTKYRGDSTANDLINHVGKTIRMVGNYIAYKRLRTSKGETMAFGTFTDIHGDFFDSVHFPPSLKEHPFKGWGVYLMLGKVTEDFGVPSIEVHKMARLEVIMDDRHD